MNPENEKKRISHFDHADYRSAVPYMRGRGWTLCEVRIYVTGFCWSTWTRPTRSY